MSLYYFYCAWIVESEILARSSQWNKDLMQDAESVKKRLWPGKWWGTSLILINAMKHSRKLSNRLFSKETVELHQWRSGTLKFDTKSKCYCNQRISVAVLLGWHYVPCIDLMRNQVSSTTYITTMLCISQHKWCLNCAKVWGENLYMDLIIRCMYNAGSKTIIIVFLPGHTYLQTRLIQKI